MHAGGAVIGDADDMERLGNLVALLASEGGEAENAGRAVGTLARKLGLSGGDLKEIFVAGVTAVPAATRRVADEGVADIVARETAKLRESLGLSEVTARNLQRERDALSRENRALRSALDRRRTGEQVTRILGAMIIVGTAVGAGLYFFGPAFPSPTGEQAEPAGSPFARGGQVRRAGAVVYERPDTESPVITRYASGTHVAIRRLFWAALRQWAEIDVEGKSGFVVTTDIDLS